MSEKYRLAELPSGDVTVLKCVACRALIEESDLWAHESWHKEQTTAIEKAGRWKPAPRFG